MFARQNGLYEILTGSDNHPQLKDIIDISTRIKALQESSKDNHDTETFTKEATYLYQCLNKLQSVVEKPLPAKDVLAIEMAKLTVVQIVLNTIPMPRYANETVLRESSRLSWPTLKRGFVYAFSIIGTVFAGVSGFVCGKALLGLLPAVASPFILPFGIICGVVEGLLFLGLDAKDSWQRFGCSPLRRRPLINVYSQQMLVIQSLHKNLLSPRYLQTASAATLKAQQSLATLLLNDLKCKHRSFITGNKGSILKVGIKAAICTLNGIFNVGAGMLFSKSVLGLVCSAATVATPLGWALIGIGGICSLASFVFLRRKSIFNLFESLSGLPKALVLKQKKFIEGRVESFHHELKAVIAHKESLDLRQQNYLLEINQLKNKLHNQNTRQVAYRPQRTKLNQIKKLSTFNKPYQNRFTNTAQTSTNLISYQLFFKSNGSKYMARRQIKELEKNSF